MALTSTLGSPGIEIREVDNSYRLDSSTATTVYIPGFASQGPVEEVMSVGSISDFETIYGTPTNAAERYFYYTVKAVLDNSGNGVTVLTSRLPYGSGKGDTVSNAYTLLAYPAVPVIKKQYKEETPVLDAEGKFVYSYEKLTISTDKKFESPAKNISVTLAKDSAFSSAVAKIGDTTLTLIDKKIISSTVVPKTEDKDEYTLYTIELTFSDVINNSFKIVVKDIVSTSETSFINEDTEIKDIAYSTTTSQCELKVTTIEGEVDFDQFKFSNIQAKDDFISLLTVKDEGEVTYAPTIEDFILTIDEDYTSDTLTISGIEGKPVPAITTIIDFDSTEETSYKAPEISFLEGHKAKGTWATELYKTAEGKFKTRLHLSYTVFNGTKKIGSFYVNALYNADITAESTSSKSSTVTAAKTVDLTLFKAFEVASSYQGQSVKQFTDKNEKLTDFSDKITYILGSPATFQISLNEYYKIVTGEKLNWSRRPYDFSGDESVGVPETSEENSAQSEGAFGKFDAIGHSAFLVINTSRSIINNNFEGFYLGMTDNMFVNPSDDYVYDAIKNVKITTKTVDSTEDNMKGLLDNVDNTGDFHALNTNRLSFYLDSNYQGSLSRALTRNVTSMDISGTEYDDTISMGLFKLSKSTTSSDILKLNYSVREKYNWSFGKTRVKSVASATHPVSYFAENIVENSNNLTILMNPYIAEKAFVDIDGVVHGKMRVLGDKLAKNLDTYEAKYLLRDYVDLKSNDKVTAKKQAVSAIVPARLAKSSIESWKTMVAQAGITPSLIKSTFKNISLGSSDTVSEYKTFAPLNSIMPFGTYTEATNANKIIGQLPSKLERALELVENDEEYPNIDIVLESGLGTVYAYSMGSELASESGSNAQTLFIDESNPNLSISGEESKETVFDETIVLSGMEDLRTGRTSISDEAQEVVENYRAVQAVFTNFANSMQNGGRGDCFYISDIPRGILIKGKNTKVTDLFGSTIENNAYDFGDAVNHSFSTSIYYPIKHTFDTIVSSYMSTYAQWVKILDGHSSEKVWIPVSGYIAGNMAATDGTYGPWYAAAGLRRGVISGVLDYALSPSVTQRTDLYKICINSVPKIPNYGVTIWGIRTMSKAASAFDQNTCRRTFLYMEKKVKQTLRYYIFEPNTSYTRLQIVNDLDPFLEKVKNAGGIYSYTLVCDTTNNTPDVINNGDLAVSIAAAPTRTAENIVVEFTANKYTEEVSAAESIS